MRHSPGWHGRPRLSPPRRSPPGRSPPRRSPPRRSAATALRVRARRAPPRVAARLPEASPRAPVCPPPQPVEYVDDDQFCRQKVAKMDEEKLINMVRARRELYDLNHPLYDVRTRRDLAWKQIGEALKHSPRDCRDKWKRLRDCYRRAQKLRRLKSEQGARMIKRPKYEKLLTFLNAHLRDDVCNEHSSADNPDSSNDENSIAEEVCGPGGPFTDGTSTSCGRVCEPAPAAEPVPVHSPYPALLDCVYAAAPAPHPAPPPAPQRDKITDFFMGLIETVRDLPEDVQIRVKRDVFKVVSEAEELVYKSKTENPLSTLDFVKEENE